MVSTHRRFSLLILSVGLTLCFCFFALTQTTNAVPIHPVVKTAFGGRVLATIPCLNGGSVFFVSSAIGGVPLPFFQFGYISYKLFFLPALPLYRVVGEAVNIFIPCLPFGPGGFLVIQNGITLTPSPF